jgi:hypothetical protein
LIFSYIFGAFGYIFGAFGYIFQGISIMENRLNFVPDDGYTEPGYLTAVPGKTVEMRFTFRPMLSEEKRALLEAVEKMKPTAEVIKIASELAERIKSWDLADGKQNILPITVAAVRRLKPSIFWSLWRIVSGDDASDIDPQWSDVEKERVVADLAESIAKPAPVGESREAADEKNSAAA